jgi:hypothetical protein
LARFDGRVQSGETCRTGGCVLIAQQLLRFDRPGHDFRVQANPVRFQALPESGTIHGFTQPIKNLVLLGGDGEEWSPGAGVHNAKA